MQRALVIDIDPQYATKVAKKDWKRDVCPEQNTAQAVTANNDSDSDDSETDEDSDDEFVASNTLMNFEHFRDSLFEIADMWCDKIDADVYAAFLDDLFGAVADFNAEKGTWRCKSDRDITCVADDLRAKYTHHKNAMSQLYTLHKRQQTGPPNSQVTFGGVEDDELRPLTPFSDTSSRHGRTTRRRKTTRRSFYEFVGEKQGTHRKSLMPTQPSSRPGTPQTFLCEDEKQMEITISTAEKPVAQPAKAIPQEQPKIEQSLMIPSLSMEDTAVFDDNRRPNQITLEQRGRCFDFLPALLMRSSAFRNHPRFHKTPHFRLTDHDGYATTGGNNWMQLGETRNQSSFPVEGRMTQSMSEEAGSYTWSPNYNYGKAPTPKKISPMNQTLPLPAITRTKQAPPTRKLSHRPLALQDERIICELLDTL